MTTRRLTAATTDYTRDMKAVVESGALELMNLEFLRDSNACVLGTPEECADACERYKDAGVDLLLCLDQSIQKSRTTKTCRPFACSARRCCRASLPPDAF